MPIAYVAIDASDDCLCAAFTLTKPISEVEAVAFGLYIVVWAEEGSAATYFVVSSLRFRRLSIKAVFGAKVLWSRWRGSDFYVRFLALSL